VKRTIVGAAKKKRFLGKTFIKPEYFIMGCAAGDSVGFPSGSTGI
jgi:hypothetical protein